VGPQKRSVLLLEKGTKSCRLVRNRTTVPVTFSLHLHNTIPFELYIHVTVNSSAGVGGEKLSYSL
jgi:hypothetical protein